MTEARSSPPTIVESLGSDAVTAEAAHTSAPTGRRWIRKPRSSELFTVVLVVVLASLVVYPIGMLIYGSFRSAPPLQDGSFTLDNYTDAFSSPLLAETAKNTLILGVSQTVISVALATALAWVVTRTNTPGRRYFEFLVMVLFLMPGLLAVVAWSLLLGPNSGLINTTLANVPGLPEPFFNVYSLYGIVAVQALYLTPLAFFIMAAAMKGMDPSLEEAARMCGASTWQTLRRTTLPLIRPALLSSSLLLFIVAIETFEIPQLLGARNRTYVFTSLIYSNLKVDFPPNYGQASALATALLVVSLVAVWIYVRATRNSDRFETVKGKGFKPGTVDLGRWRWGTSALCWAFFALTVFLPMIVIFIGSLVPFIGRFHTGMFEDASWRNYERLFQHPTLVEATKHSLWLSATVGAIVVVFGTLLAYVLVRLRIRGSGIIEGTAMLPIAYPSTVLALGMLWAYITLPIPIYGTLTILGVAYLTRYTPIGLRAVSGGMAQISSELEEASRMSGAGLAYTLRRVVLPLMRNSMMGAWILMFMIFMKELAMSVLLAGPGNAVISVVLFDYYQSGSLGILCAFATIFVLFIVVLTFIVQRILKVSMTMH